MIPITPFIRRSTISAWSLSNLSFRVENSGMISIKPFIRRSTISASSQSNLSLWDQQFRHNPYQIFQKEINDFGTIPITPFIRSRRFRDDPYQTFQGRSTVSAWSLSNLSLGDRRFRHDPYQTFHDDWVAIREKLDFLGSNLQNSRLEFWPEQILG